MSSPGRPPADGAPRPPADGASAQAADSSRQRPAEGLGSRAPGGGDQRPAEGLASRAPGGGDQRLAEGLASRAPGGGGPSAAGTARLRAALRGALARELEDAVRLRHELHAHPEVSGSEDQTAATVAAALGAPGAPTVAGTGRLVRIGPAAGPCVAIRAELDALPIAEQTGVAWASQTGAMHACGHDVHLAALVALGRAASQTELPAALLAVLQPREEAPPSGARDIVSAKAFAAQQARAIVGAHLQPQLPPRTAGAPAGAVNASSDDFEIVVEGLGGHAGYPHLTVDPVPALCQIVLALQHIVSRRTDPTHAAAVSVGMLAAGQAPNIIPGTARACGTLRALEPADRPAMSAALREIAEHTSLAHGCRATVTIEEGEPALVNDEALTAATWPWLRQAGFAVDTSFRSCGADDFAFYTQAAPSLMIFVGTDSSISLHHPEFLPPDDAIGQVAEAMLAGYLAALSLLLAQPARSELPVGLDLPASLDLPVSPGVGALASGAAPDVAAGLAPRLA